MEKVQIAIIGGGSAGLSAAVSAFDAGIKDIVVFEKEDKLGGILNQCIHNGFGLHTFKEELTGPEYAYKYIVMAQERNIKTKVNTMVLDITKDKVITYCNGEEGVRTIEAECIIFACGCNERTGGQISLPGDRPKGVFTAGLAQKILNIDGYLVGKNVYILGSGDIGLIMARRMTLEGAKVIGVSELMPYSNGLNRNIVQCLNDFNIPLKLSNTVTKIIGYPNLEAIELSDVDENLNVIEGTQKIVKCDTLLLSIGLYPFNTLLANAGAKANIKTKGAEVDQNLETSLPGVFSCGNVLHVHDLVDFVSEEGTLAGKNAANLILNGRKPVLKQVGVDYTKEISYVLPNFINMYEDTKEVTFKFRVRKIIKKAKIHIKDGDNLIKTFIKTDLIPSEMVKLTIKDFTILGENISIVVEEL